MLSIEELSYAYGQSPALDGVSIAVGAREILCLLGPSGCGKTTLLRIVAGLQAGYRGRVAFDGQDLRDLPTQKRGFGLMFQDFALFPHMSVADNVAYGLRRQRLPSQDIKRRARQMLDDLGLSGFGGRDVSALSGGEKQRVALARSLAPQPRFLMLDEPLGSLDALLRDQLALELRRIIKRAGLSAIYVTHDHREAYAIADRIAVMEAGAIRQVAAPAELYRHPRSAFVARFLGFSNIFRFNDSDLTRALAKLLMTAPGLDQSFLIHPEGIHLVECPPGPVVGCQGEIESLVFRGDHRDLRIAIAPDMTISCRSPRADLREGGQLAVFISADAIRLID